MSPEIEPPVAGAPAVAPTPPIPHPTGVAPPLPKRPWLAAFFAAFPGLGHVYNGLYRRAVTIFAAFVACIVLIIQTDAAPFGVAMAFLWFFNVLDSYRQATLINLGYATDLGLSDQPQRLRPGQGTLIAGITLFVLGGLELLHRVDLWQWRWLVDYWPVPFMAIGAWLVVASLRERSRTRTAPEDSYSDYAEDGPAS